MKIHVIRCVIAMALFIGLSGMASADPITSITEIPGGQTISFTGLPTGFDDPNALDIHLAPFGMRVAAPLANFAGFVDDLPTGIPSNPNTGTLGPNNVSFGDLLDSTITIETTGLPWIAIGYAAGVDHFFDTESTFSIVAYDEAGAVIETVNQVFTSGTAVFVGVKTSAFTPIHKIDLIYSSLNDAFGWFDNLTFKPISEPDLQPLTALVYNGYTYSLEPPIPGCDGGVVILTLNFQYNGGPDVTNLRFRIEHLDAPRTALGANGSDVGIPDSNLGPDATLTTGEAFGGDLSICLPDLSSFNLTLDVYGRQPTPTKRVFVTSAAYDGDLGGLAGADAICQAHADAGALGGAWTAWVSAPGAPAASRITDSFYVLVDNGTIVATGLADLTSGSLIESIFLTELGTIASTDAWTGTAANGAETVNTCNAWSSNLASVFGDYGSSAASNAFWTLNAAPASCDSMLSLYCFEK